MQISPINRREVVPSLIDADSALRLLSRHQVRRRQRIPTVTVLAGRDGAPAQLVRSWAESEQRPLRESSSIEQADAVSRWFATLVETQNVTEKAYAWLAGRAGGDAKQLPFELRMRSLQEQTMFLDRTLGTKNVPPVDAVCRAIVESSCQDGPTMRGLWQRLLGCCAGDLVRAMAGVFALVGEEGIPVLHVTARKNDLVPLRTILAKVVSLVSVTPALPVIVTTSPERLDEYLTTTPECHALALVREGTIWLADDEPSVPTADRGAVAAEGAAAGSDQTAPSLASKTAPLAQNGADDVRGETRSELTDSELRTADDETRSAAERYLFERLQAHPATADLFELNAPLELTGGGRTLEVDLLARGARVAVEIDGYYHFTDLDAYRRDRQKDRLLQHAGYFVLRCLADDVASRLEEILEAIIAAVRRPLPERGRAGRGSCPDSELAS